MAITRRAFLAGASFAVVAPTLHPEWVTRMPEWDGRSPDSVSPADWLNVNLGHSCERCGSETHRNTGGRVVAGDVVCEECLSFSDRVAIEPDDVVDDLANRLADEGEDDVRRWLEAQGNWGAVKDDLWPRALAAVREGEAA